MDVGETAMTHDLEFVSVNWDTSLIATGKLVLVIVLRFQLSIYVFTVAFKIY